MTTKKTSSRLRAEKRRGDLPCPNRDDETPLHDCLSLPRHHVPRLTTTQSDDINVSTCVVLGTFSVLNALVRSACMVTLCLSFLWKKEVFWFKDIKLTGNLLTLQHLALLSVFAQNQLSAGRALV